MSTQKKTPQETKIIDSDKSNIEIDSNSENLCEKNLNHANNKISLSMATFRNRRYFIKRSIDLVDDFDSVLDDNAAFKTKKILRQAESASGTESNLLDEAKKSFSDPSDLSLVLQKLINHTEYDDAINNKLKKTLEQLVNNEDAKNLKAGVNCALKARLFSSVMSVEPQFLRASYRQFIQSNECEIELYILWISDYGHNNRVIVLDYIESALLCDIDSHDPSCSHLEFGYLLGLLNKIKLLRSSEVLFIKKMTCVSSFNQFDDIDDSKWLFVMFSLLQHDQDTNALLYDAIGFERFIKRQKEYILYALYTSINSLPDSLFLNSEKKIDVLNSIKLMTELSANS